MINEKIIEFVANILKKRKYEITVYRQNCFRASYKNNHCINIEVNGETDKLIIESSIWLYSNGKTLEQSIKVLTEQYKIANKDIKYINKQLKNIANKKNIIDVLKTCNVPKAIVDTIKEVLL